MSAKMKPIILGELTESIIRLIFDKRAALESNDDSLNTMSRTLKIKDLKNQVLSFIKRNPNCRFMLEVPEYNTEKITRLQFSNFVEPTDEDEIASSIELIINDRFTKCIITEKVTIGKDIVLTLTS